MYDCEICYCSYEKHEMVFLLCDHTFCNYCLGDFLNNLIMSAKTTSNLLVCPDQNCRKPLDINLVLSILSKETKEKYYTFMIRDVARKMIDESSFQVVCPRCQYFFIADISEHFKSLTYTQCSNCNHKFCPHCQEDPHKEVTCDAYK